MANWCNSRLIVVGLAPDVRRFSRLAYMRPLSLFRPDMVAGESQKLFSERARALGLGRSKKAYIFQVRSDDGIDHFRNASRSYPALRFLLVYGYDDHCYGSYFIQRGRARSYCVPARIVEKVMLKHGVNEDPDCEWPYDAEVEAEAELMDLAEAHWDTALFDSTSLTKVR